LPKTGGDVTKRKILEVSEKLFSEQGYDKTSIEEIAKSVGINKATIYFHFKSKNEIMNTLFKTLIEELNERLRPSVKEDMSNIELTEKLRMEIEFVSQHEKIMTVMLMESLKKGNENNFLFKCAELTMDDDLHSSVVNRESGTDGLTQEEKQRFYVHEFFTGFVPFIIFVIFRKRWASYFKVKDKKLFEYFMDSFKRSHVDSHMKF